MNVTHLDETDDIYVIVSGDTASDPWVVDGETTPLNLTYSLKELIEYLAFSAGWHKGEERWRLTVDGGAMVVKFQEDDEGSLDVEIVLSTD